MAEPATRADIHALLAAHALEAFSALQLDVEDAQLSAPREGAPRLKVAVRPGRSVHLPASLPFHLRGREVIVPLEVTSDFQDYQLH